MTQDVRDIAEKAKAWPFEEARRLLKRLNGKAPDKGYVLFECGYGPSGVPHIGTFCEVLRPTMVKQAFEVLAPDIPTRLICFIDDMDGLRKVPDNVPNKKMMEDNLGKPVSKIPDPFNAGYESFAHHNTARLKNFLDEFGFECELISSTAYYESGKCDEALRAVLKNYDAIMEIMLPTLGAERQKTYSPILPISPKTGRVLQVPILDYDVDAATVVFEDEDGTKVEQEITRGKSKLQWKPDWAAHWYTLDADYEMYGKDLITTFQVAAKICRAMGKTPPENAHFELFLDENGEKISKSRGNGLTIEEWLRYAPEESLAYYMYLKPKTAKRLFFDVIPKAVDEYVAFARKLPDEEPAKQVENPAWHVNKGQSQINSLGTMPVSFNLLLNLASAANAENKDVLWGFISRYAPEATPQTEPFLDRLTQYAVNYYQDFVKPDKRYRAPTESESAALEDLLSILETLQTEFQAEDIQTQIYEVGKRHGYEDNLRGWFRVLYETLLGQEQGPRMGSFIVLYGLDETKSLIRSVLDKSLPSRQHS